MYQVVCVHFVLDFLAVKEYWCCPCRLLVGTQFVRIDHVVKVCNAEIVVKKATRLDFETMFVLLVASLSGIRILPPIWDSETL